MCSLMNKAWAISRLLALRQQRGDLQFPGGRVAGCSRPCAGRPGGCDAGSAPHGPDPRCCSRGQGLPWRLRATDQLPPFRQREPRARWSGSAISAPPERLRRPQPVASHADDRCPGRTWPDHSPTPLPHDGVGEYHSCQRGGDPVGEDRFRIDNDGSQGRGAQADSSAG